MSFRNFHLTNIINYTSPILLLDNVFLMTNTNHLYLHTKLHQIIQSTNLLIAYSSIHFDINIIEYIYTNLQKIYQLCGINLSDKCNFSGYCSLVMDGCFYFDDINFIHDLLNQTTIQQLDPQTIIIHLISCPDILEEYNTYPIQLKILYLECFYNTIHHIDLSWSKILQDKINTLCYE